MNQEVAIAVVAVDHFAGVLRREDPEGWAIRFEQIARALEIDPVEATRLWSSTSYTGPGSLSDIYAKDEPVFYAAWGTCSNALQSLKQQLSKS